jgi:hypothetical protein
MRRTRTNASRERLSLSTLEIFRQSRSMVPGRAFIGDDVRGEHTEAFAGKVGEAVVKANALFRVEAEKC